MTKKKVPTQVKEAVAEAISGEQARAAIEREKQERAAKFLAIVQQAQAQYRCQLVAVMVLTGGAMPQADVRIVAQE